jgi:hypothetical protein
VSRSQTNNVYCTNNQIISNLETMLSPKIHQLNPYAPLHKAAQLNDLVAFKALVDAGADIEQLDYNSFSPLHIAANENASSIAKYLICLGARLNRRLPDCRTPILSACLTVSSQVIQYLLKGGARPDVVDDFGDNCLTLLTTPRTCRRGPPSISAFKALIDAGIDPFAKNKSGLDAAHTVLISETSIYLCYILSRFPGFFDNKSLSWTGIQTRGPTFMDSIYALSLSKHLRLIRPFLTTEKFLDLADLSPFQKHTFFCSSVISGFVEAVRNFLKYGANLEHACPEHGTPLVAAWTHFQFEIVKILVRSGAKIFTDEFLATGVPFTEYDGKQKRWLLVERHYEQPKIEERGFDNDRVPTQRAGVAMAEVEMDWNWKRRQDESMLGYAKRRQTIVRGLRGSQVKVIRIV